MVVVVMVWGAVACVGVRGRVGVRERVAVAVRARVGVTGSCGAMGLRIASDGASPVVVVVVVIVTVRVVVRVVVIGVVERDDGVAGDVVVSGPPRAPHAHRLRSSTTLLAMANIER
jgi:hypothetical protein